MVKEIRSTTDKIIYRSSISWTFYKFFHSFESIQFRNSIIMSIEQEVFDDGVTICMLAGYIAQF